MQKLILKLILLLVISFITKTFYAQNTQKVVQANMSYGRNAQDCRHSGNFTCGVQTANNKAIGNSQMFYDKKTNQLTIEIRKNKIKTTIKRHLKNIEKNNSTYTFTDDLILPEEILKQLDIKNKTKIAKGDYLVKDKGNVFEIVVKLE